jgi:hypothetical protein
MSAGVAPWVWGPALAALLSSCTPEAAQSAAPVAPVTRRDDPQPYLPRVARGVFRTGATVGVSASMAEDDVRSSALAFMRAWLAEDIEGLMALISEDFALGAGGRSISRQVLREAWQRQFARLDFTQFTVDEVVDHDAIEVIPYDDQAQRGGPSQGVLRGGDLLVRLRMRVTQRNRRRYFEDVLELWFRRQRGRWLIVALGE